MPDPNTPLLDTLGIPLPQAFTISDEFRILKHLQIGFSYRGYLQSQIGGTIGTLTTVQERQLYVQMIQGILTELDELESLRIQQGIDSQSTLIRADVLEWSPGGQVVSVQARQGEQRRQLASLLNCEWLMGGGGGGSAIVLRS